ncbi:MAG: hypothetical protein JSU82_15590 [Rhodospirillales bacterium]|nr:MAG: hypothetical protein JSU82_15590 [Rhodospirillales bacterium]
MIGWPPSCSHSVAPPVWQHQAAPQTLGSVSENRRAAWPDGLLAGRAMPVQRRMAARRRQVHWHFARRRSAMSVDAIPMAGSVCERIELRMLRSPLRVPYKLSLGTIDAFDSLLVTVSDGTRTGVGEATFLPGYSEETAATGWARALKLATPMPGRPLHDAVTAAEFAHGDAAFTATAFTTAFEMLAGHPILTIEKDEVVPLLAIVNSIAPAAFEPEIESHLAAGYRTLKVKVGFDVEADIERVRRIRHFVAGRATLRLDGNQGFDRDQALHFARALEPEGIELFEQPCAAGDWAAAAALAEVSPVPMMLDESIYGIAEIERAAALGAARYIKLKLMKAGGLDALVSGLRRIRALGMIPILGNGVATDIGCWMEACVATREIDTAGEMNGFLKPRTGLFCDPLRVEGGVMRLAPGGMPALDTAAIESLTVDRREFLAS